MKVSESVMLNPVYVLEMKTHIPQLVMELSASLTSKWKRFLHDMNKLCHQPFIELTFNRQLHDGEALTPLINHYWSNKLCLQILFNLS